MKKKPEDGSARKLFHDLTDTDIKRTKLPKLPKKYIDLRDGKGLYLRIQANGKKIWKIDYYVNKKRNTMTLGYYPIISLKQAREEAEKAKALAKQGTNPYTAKILQKEEQEKKKNEEKKTFKDVADEWLDKIVNTSNVIESTKTMKKTMLELYVYPKIGKVLFKNVTYTRISDLLFDIYKNRKSDLSQRIGAMLNQICKWANRRGYSDKNIAEGLNEEYRKMKVVRTPRPAILDPTKLGEYLNKVDACRTRGTRVMSEAMELFAYIPVRSQELRQAKIDEFDFEKNIWRIPAQRMKTRKEHVVPLPKKIALKFKELIEATGTTDYVFSSRKNCLSKTGIIERLMLMGYKKGELCVHGFRATFSTLMRETGLYTDEIIERQLAHAYGNAVSRAYDRGDYLEKRRQCLEDYCYILDELKKGREFNDIVKELRQKHYEMDMK